MENEALSGSRDLTSVFGIPFDRLDNLKDDRALTHSITDSELSIFVGGRYNQFHDNILLVFGLNATADTRQTWLLSTVYRLVSVLPPLVILLCQIGFALVQSGAARFESAATPFFANMIAFALTGLSYFMVGYTVSRTEGFTTFGYQFWFGNGFNPQESPDWLLGFALALTTVNIAFHGGLDRCPLFVYALLAPILSGVVHAMSVHWAWHYDGWLLELSPFTNVKYQDFGGSGIIHIVGGASALTLSVVLGPRYNRIWDRKSKVLYNDLEGHSVPTEMLGGYLLCVCYVCINCSRVFQTCVNCSPTEDLGIALINTFVASGTSGLITTLTVMLVTRVLGRHRIHWPPSKYVMNGLHVGMVAVAAGCNVYPFYAAAAIGATSALGYVLWSLALYIGNNDDPVGVAAVHLGGGIWGLICVSLFETETGLIFGRNIVLSLMGVVWNLIGGLTLAGFSALATVVVIVLPRILNLMPLSIEQEINGLDGVCIQQSAYSSANKAGALNNESIEDRGHYYGNESPGSTDVTNLMSPGYPNVLSPAGISVMSPSDVNLLSPTGTRVMSSTGTNLLSPAGTRVMSSTGTNLLSPAGTRVMSSTGTNLLSPAGTRVLSSTGTNLLSPAGTRVMSSSGTNLLSPTRTSGYSFSKPHQEVSDAPFFTEIPVAPYSEIPYYQAFFIRSPSGESDRRVWFNSSSLRDYQAPDSPLIDYHKNYPEFGEISLRC